MAGFVEALRSRRPLFMDGAMGTELLRAGMAEGVCLDRCNLTHPEVVRGIHQAYVAAGAEVLLTHTFQANPDALRRGGHEHEAEAIIAAAIEAARSAGAEWVLGDVGPWNADPADIRRLAACFAGVDAFLLETWSDSSALDAARRFQEASGLPVLVSFTFRTTETGAIRTWSGQTPGELALQASDSGIAALGVNCGKEQDSTAIARTLRDYRQATDLPLFARPNAGTPRRSDDGWHYPRGPHAFAEEGLSLLDAGAAMLGGCCGTTPDHIAALIQRCRPIS